MTISNTLEKIEPQKKTSDSPYELGKTLFGHYSSDRNDLSTSRKAILKKKLRTKHRH